MWLKQVIPLIMRLKENALEYPINKNIYAVNNSFKSVNESPNSHILGNDV